MDGILLHALIHELQALAGAKINKIHQPNAHEVVIQCRNHGRNLKLLMSAHPVYARLQLTERAFDNPLEPPMFCMLLRKYLENGIIETVRQISLERIVHIDCKHYDDLGDLRRKRLIIELMGRHSNIILYDPERELILDGIHHVTPAISGYRVIMPGVRYTEPPHQEKCNLVTTDEREWRRLLSEHGTEAESLVKQFLGFSPQLARLLTHSDVGVVNSRLNQLKQMLLENKWQAVIDSTTKPTLHIVHRHLLTGGSNDSKSTESPAAEVYPSLCAALEAFYGDRAERDSIKQKSNDLFRLVHSEREKNEQKRQKLLLSLRESEAADDYRIKGELLTASLHTLSKGQRTAQVVNYYDEHQRPLEIELDPLLSPAENAQRYFRKYTKLKNGVAMINEQIRQTDIEIDYFNALSQQIEIAGFRDIEEIREELVEQGYLRNRQKQRHKKKHKKEQKPEFLLCHSSDGTPIWIGRNNKQNDYITMKLAHQHDTWLHTKDIPGSHVIIHAASFSEQTLTEAAQLAAYHSRARQSSRVPVDYTLVRQVRKPNGAKPGFVIYEQQKTIFVTPDEQHIQSLLTGAR